MTMMKEEEEEEILRLQCKKFVENLTVTKHVKKFPVHKGSSLHTVSLSLDDPLQYYPPFYTYTFIS